MGIGLENIDTMNADDSIKRETKLYGLNLNFNEIVNLSNSNKLPNKILLSGPKGIGKCTMAYHLINFIFSKNEDEKYIVVPRNVKLAESPSFGKPAILYDVKSTGSIAYQNLAQAIIR